MIACDYVLGPVVVDVPYPSSGLTKLIPIIKGCRETSGRVRYLLVVIYRAVGLQEQDVQCSPISSAVIIWTRSNSNVLYPVVVKVAYPRDRLSKKVPIIKGCCETSGGVRYLLEALHGTVGVHEQDVNGSSVCSPVIIPRSPDRNVLDPVVVEVPYAAGSLPETVSVRKASTKFSVRVRYLLVALHRAVGVQKEDVQRSSTRSAIIVSYRSHCDILDPVVVEVSYLGDRITEIVSIIKGCRKTSSRVRYLLEALHGAVGVHEQDVHCAPVGAAIIIFTRTYGDILDAIVVDVTYPSDHLAKKVSIGKVRSEVSGGIRYLLGPTHRTF